MFFRPTYPNFFAFEAGNKTIFFLPNKRMYPSLKGDHSKGVKILYFFFFHSSFPEQAGLYQT
jgi:hypothetical protein